ncbi:MAG: hypothetical protein JSU73_04430, partial [candidate division WOR-3 bacterium]
MKDIVSPAGMLSPGEPVRVQATVRNNGDLREACRVVFSISTDPRYDQAVDLANGLPYTDTLLRFPDWTTVPGSFVTKCSTYMASDQVASNNVVLGNVDVVSSRPTGWSEKSSMPLPPSGRPVKRGGWLVFNAGTGLAFGQKGNKTHDFYSYDPGPDVWTPLSGMPTRSHPMWSGKPPRKGSKGCSDGGNVIYVTQGNN